MTSNNIQHQDIHHDHTKQLRQEMKEQEQKQYENDNKDEIASIMSTNSMDVSSSTTTHENIFMSPPQSSKSSNKQVHTKTPAQKRRQRRYNLRKFKRSKRNLNNKPIIMAPKQTDQLIKSQALSTNSKTPKNSTTTETVKVQFKKDTATKKTHNTT